MILVLAVLVAIAWVAATVLVVSLGAAAKRGDRQIGAHRPPRGRHRRVWLPPRAPREDQDR